MRYWGPRSDIFEKYLEKSPAVQILDICAPGDPLQLARLPANWDFAASTVILSTRRYDVDDEIGRVEAGYLEQLQSAVIMRCSPLSKSLPLYQEWSSYSGLLATSFDAAGVAWLAVEDLLDALPIIADQIPLRHGQAFDLTGPRRISMQELSDEFEKNLGIEVTPKEVPAPEMLGYLIQNGMPADFAEWTVRLQVLASDPRLEDTTGTLESVLGRAARNPLNF